MPTFTVLDAAGQPVEVTLPGGASDTTRSKVESLGTPLLARQATASASNTNVVLTASCTRVSIHCRGANARYVVGSAAQTANATTSHFIADGERLDISLPASPNIAFIRDSAATSNATIEITELT